MDTPKIYYLIAITIGGFLGGLVPKIWGGSAFSMASIFTSTIGAFVFLWIAYKIYQEYLS